MPYFSFGLLHIHGHWQLQKSDYSADVLCIVKHGIQKRENDEYLHILDDYLD